MSLLQPRVTPSPALREVQIGFGDRPERPLAGSRSYGSARFFDFGGGVVRPEEMERNRPGIFRTGFTVA